MYEFKGVKMLPGDVLAFKVPPFTHYLIVSESETAIFNSFTYGCVVQKPLFDVLVGRNFWSIGYPGNLPRHEVVTHASRRLGQPWSLFYNCEHFYRDAHGLEPQSPQLKLGLTLAALIGIISLAARA